MEVYALATSEQTREALRQLGSELGWEPDGFETAA
jgi:hypothetical protein